MSRKPGAPAAGQAWAPFEAAVLPHVDRLFRLALWFERDRSEAEDLVQEAMRLAGAVFRDGPTLSRSDRATVRCDHVHWCHGYRCSGREPSGPRGYRSREIADHSAVEAVESCGDGLDRPDRAADVVGQRVRKKLM